MDSANWIVSRAEDDSDLSSSGFQFDANSTSAWDNQLKLAAAGSVRTSIIVLASFNVLAAFATAVSILCESWKTARRNDPGWNLNSCYQASQWQDASFAGSTNTTLALFITPFIQMIFGMELTIRITKPNIFPARGRWNVVMCLVVIGLLLVLTYGITFAIRPSNFCFAGLFWYLHRYNRGCFGLLTTIVSLMLIQCGIISFKLHTGAKMSFAERDEASRMVYYMVVALVSYTLLITFFFNTTFQDPLSASPETMQLAMVVSVVANLSGLLTGCLYLFLRSSKSPSGVSEESGTDMGKMDKGFFEADGEGQDLEPSSPSSSIVPRPLRLPQQVRKQGSRETLLADVRDEGKVFGARKDILNHAFPRPLRLSMRQSQKLPARPDATRTASKASLKNFKKSMYSIFPKEEQLKSPILLPTTTYTPSSAQKAPAMNFADGLLAPPAIHAAGSGHHQRSSSMVSTATVQIGLRLSNIDDVIRPSKPPVQEDANKVHNLDCPNSTVTFFPRKTSPLAIAIVDVPGEGAMYKVQDNLEKELPPVPLGESSRRAEEAEDSEDDDNVTLSSAVYSPQGENPGPFSHTRQSESMSSRVHSRQGSRAGPRPEIRKEQWI
ncbi:hypothetical protein FDECE_4917 [Fusarium decemcellulare]|nr:hypothetical protein FDECE_4917 [Fusarium decemcellulare]